MPELKRARCGQTITLRMSSTITAAPQELTVACVDGVPVGMGKLTVLFDGSAWLELLRVQPDFQRKGGGARHLSALILNR